MSMLLAGNLSPSKPHTSSDKGATPHIGEYKKHKVQVLVILQWVVPHIHNSLLVQTNNAYQAICRKLFFGEISITIYKISVLCF